MQSATRRLVVFLSSVRRGLEQERDNLPALIQAIGHECKRFEDYTGGCPEFRGTSVAARW